MRLYKRGGVYWCDVSCNGKRARFSTKTTDRAKATKVAISKAITKVNAPTPTGIRLNQAIARYLTTITYKSSKEQEGDKAKLFGISEALGNPLLENITKPMLVAFFEQKAQKTTISTANRYISSLNCLLGAAFNEWGWLSRPLHVKQRREAVRSFKWLSKKEADNLIKNCPIWLKDIALFALHTGLRKDNILKLRWGHVDLEKKIVWVEADRAKAREAIRVPLDAEAISATVKQANVLKVVSDYDYVFDRDNIPKRLWDDVCKAAGLEGLRFHDLRHTFASWKVQAGVPIYEVMKLMGHRDIKSTLRYAHLEPNV